MKPAEMIKLSKIPDISWVMAQKHLSNVDMVEALLKVNWVFELLITIRLGDTCLRHILGNRMPSDYLSSWMPKNYIGVFSCWSYQP